MLTARQYFSTQPASTGFTLIELLIAVAIMVITLGIGIAGFIRFNDRQQVETVAKEIQTLVRTAQAKAQIREVPTENCDSLRDHRVQRSGSTYQLRIRCTGAGQNYERGTYTLPSGITATSFSVNFLPLNGGAVINNNPATESLTVTVSNSSSTTQYQFTINASGIISTGGFID